jgi:hypothetical protein
MKQCERIGDMFGELHENQLDAEKQNDARNHLCVCERCREDYKWYGITVQALGSLEPVQPPRDFLEQLHSRLYSAPPSQSFFDSFRQFFSSVPYLPLPVGVTALTFVVAVSWAVYQNAPSGVPIPGSPVAQGVLSTARSGQWSAKGFDVNRAEPKSRSLASKAYDFPAPSRGFASAPVSPKVAMADRMGTAPQAMWASTNAIGSDRLTVESPSINMAVESLKRVLPHFQGKVVEENNQGGLDEAVLAVTIPPQAWPHLTTELINHGAVAVAPSDEKDSPPRAPTKENNSVLIKIRIVNTQ